MCHDTVWIDRRMGPGWIGDQLPILCSSSFRFRVLRLIPNGRAASDFLFSVAWHATKKKVAAEPSGVPPPNHSTIDRAIEEILTTW